jgi:hypothetical protein
MAGPPPKLDPHRLTTVIHYAFSPSASSTNSDRTQACGGSADQSRLNLKAPGESATRAIHSQRRDRRFAGRRACRNHSRLAVESKVEVPAKQPWIKFPGVEQFPDAAGPVDSTDSVGLGQIAARAAQGQVPARRRLGV